MQNFFYKCNHPIFRELYSGVFKPYSDVLKSYNGVFLQFFFYECNHPIFREPYSSVFKPYSDVLKPYKGILELDFLKIMLFFLSFIGHNLIFYESSISLKLDFKVIEYRNWGISLYSFEIGAYR